jgi:hypothetical protein
MNGNVSQIRTLQVKTKADTKKFYMIGNNLKNKANPRQPRAFGN